MDSFLCSAGQVHSAWRGLKGYFQVLILAKINYLQADVLVNSTNSNLDLCIGKTSKCILEAAGPGLQRICKTKYPDGIVKGQVAVTSAENLRDHYQAIFHGVLPKRTDNWELVGIKHCYLKWLFWSVSSCLSWIMFHEISLTLWHLHSLMFKI